MPYRLVTLGCQPSVVDEINILLLALYALLKTSSRGNAKSPFVWSNSYKWTIIQNLTNVVHSYTPTSSFDKAAC